jgi:hypothetical protein
MPEYRQCNVLQRRSAHWILADGFQLGGKREYVGTYLRGLWVVEQIQAHGIRFGKKSSIVDGKQQDKTDSDVLSSRQRIENVRRYK